MTRNTLVLTTVALLCLASNGCSRNDTSRAGESQHDIHKSILTIEHAKKLRALQRTIWAVGGAEVMVSNGLKCESDEHVSKGRAKLNELYPILSTEVEAYCRWALRNSVINSQAQDNATPIAASQQGGQLDTASRRQLP